MGKEIWTKRVIGLPGDEVTINNGRVFVNGEQLEEDYLPEGTYTYQGDLGTYNVPEDCVFLMGDNRTGSRAEPSWGYRKYATLQ